MDTFTASNGTQVQTRDAGGVEEGSYVFLKSVHSKEWKPVSNWGTFSTESPIGIALAEFFRHREDERLGRWRWPENPDYVVYPEVTDLHLVTILRESLGRIRKVRRENLGSGADCFEQFMACAEAYFDAHPVARDPWEDAQHGEVWLISIENTDPLPMTVDREATNFPRFLDPIEAMSYGPKAGITSGRRIWPEN